ncbi:universal stress protein [Aquabacterium sp.]|uniref:universal stress protein n=1 Tax=Aquabacterium sp. TaxID=1872578 RepID=UPI002489B353|nr:universal stress protein [Aquabacterium sp.]MDI1259102.1 universal stress protein [Aquabacterium sp.]
MNPLRHVLVHVDGSELALERLKFAQPLAASFSARITALYAVTPWLVLHPAHHVGDQAAFATLSRLDTERRAKAHAVFQSATEGLPNVSWDEVRTQSPYDFAQHALYADLLVLGQPTHAPHTNCGVPDDFVPSVLEHSGKPALIVPANDQVFGRAVKTVLIAWNGSRESARALDAAWPFLAKAQDVHVAILGDPIDDDPASRAHLERYLGLHDIKPIWHVRRPESFHGVGTALLSLAEDVQAGLLVMGCYGHSRAREWVLGGATRTILQGMSLPVLMAH